MYDDGSCSNLLALSQNPTYRRTSNNRIIFAEKVSVYKLDENLKERFGFLYMIAIISRVGESDRVYRLRDEISNRRDSILSKSDNSWSYRISMFSQVGDVHGHRNCLIADQLHGVVWVYV